MSGCHRCATGLSHCHGTLVRHRDESVECTSSGCAGEIDVHVFVVGCDELGAGCGCGGQVRACRPRSDPALDPQGRRALAVAG
jgi:hypothetical protein